MIPDGGGMLWADNMRIPNGSQHKKNAEILINYYYDPKVAAQVAAYVNYICPVEGAQGSLQASTKSLADNPLIFPTADDLKGAHLPRSDRCGGDRLREQVPDRPGRLMAASAAPTAARSAAGPGDEARSATSPPSTTCR